MRHSGWIIFIAILVLLFFYTAFKMHQIFQGRRVYGAFIATLIFTLMLSGQFLYRRHTSLEPAWFETLYWTGTVVMGFWATLILLSIPFDLANALGSLVEKVFPLAREKMSQVPSDFSRRELLGRWVPLGLLGVSGLFSGLGLNQAIRGPQVKEVVVPVDALPPALHGLTIAQISDIHVSPLIKKGYVQNIVDQVTQLKADLIVLTGDLADGTPEDLREHVEPLEQLRAPLGQYYITGNHEYYWNAPAWIAKTRELGFIPLMNESTVLKKDAAEFILGGVTDTSSDQFEPGVKSDPAKALSPYVDHPARFRLLLAHRPESCLSAAKAGWTLQLSGHTHNGQFFPFSLLMPLAHRYYGGLHKHEGMWLYVNRGTGYWGPPNRFTIPSEITLIRLEAHS